MQNNDLKNQIIAVLNTKLKSEGVTDVEKILIYYQKGQRIKVKTDNDEPAPLDLSSNLFVSNFLIAQLKSQLKKIRTEKVDITYSLITVNLKSSVVLIDCFYDTKTDKQQILNLTL